jgi:hypothetical protein
MNVKETIAAMEEDNARLYRLLTLSKGGGLQTQYVRAILSDYMTDNNVVLKLLREIQ